MDNLTAYNASEYDGRIRQTIPFYETIHSEVLRLVRLARPDTTCWVDTGCGTGILVRKALEAFPRAQFIIADPSEAMLLQARSRFADAPAARFRLLPPSDSAGLTSHIPPAQANVVTAIQCHHYLQPEGRLQALRSCREILRPGGLFITFENISPRTPDGVRLRLARLESLPYRKRPPRSRSREAGRPLRN